MQGGVPPSWPHFALSDIHLVLISWIDQYGQPMGEDLIVQWPSVCPAEHGKRPATHQLLVGNL